MELYISSKDNEKIKNIKKLDDKKYRNKAGLFVTEGIKIVREAINSMYTIEFIVYNRETLEKTDNGQDILNEIEKKCANTTCISVTKEILEYLTDTVNPQGIIAVIKKEEKDILDYLSLNKKEKFLIIDRVQDAGNLGSIIRSCNAFCVKNIICVKGTVDPYMNKVVRSTMGGILKTNIFEIEEEKIEELINALREKNYKIFTTSLYNSLDLRDIVKENKINENAVFVVGNEANGASDMFLEKSDLRVRIPMEPTAESLNVAMATSIVLYQQYIAK
ncbi:MAG: RNA methyltransferase [Clostridia bacterium]